MYGCFFLFYSSHLSIYLKVNLVFWLYVKYCWGFPGGSDGNESTCNVGDPHLIFGLGRCPREGHGCPLQYSYLENTRDRGAWWATVEGDHTEFDITDRLSTHTYKLNNYYSSASRLGLHLGFSINPGEALTGFS